MPSNSTRNQIQKKRKRPASLGANLRENSTATDGQSQSEDVIEIFDDEEEGAKKEAAERDSNCCLITLESEPTSLFQVLRLRPDKDKEVLAQLEYAWGMKSGKLNLEVPFNKILLKTDFGTTLNSGNWALLPTLDVLQQIAAKTLVLNYSTKNWPVYLEWFSVQPRDYHFVHFADAPKAFLRFSDTSTTKQFVSYEHPFHNVPLISSRLHPYFAICDVAIKAELQTERKIELHKLQPQLRECVDLCLAICKQWLELHRTGATVWESLTSALAHAPTTHPVPLVAPQQPQSLPRRGPGRPRGRASSLERGRKKENVHQDLLEPGKGHTSSVERERKKGSTRQDRAASVDSSEPRYPKRQRHSIARA